ncbi:hypothetical protein BVC80_955g15 [Macleaya cordata]|uniref:Retrotransposon gag domain-containing protein n=1 Tax=Macleaya cordata TaxID=56857 RepID=A0A200R0E0_MACCD|nr:hypothetical protein BVC80_955g15 [Macleaya cordata]
MEFLSRNNRSISFWIPDRSLTEITSVKKITGGRPLKLKDMARGANQDDALAQALREMTEALRETRSGPLVSPELSEETRTMTIIREFHRYDPPKFKGTTNPLEAENWLADLEKRMDFLRVDDMLRVDLAVYLLTEEANHWCASMRNPRKSMLGRETTIGRIPSSDKGQIQLWDRIHKIRMGITPSRRNVTSVVRLDTSANTVLDLDNNNLNKVKGASIQGPINSSNNNDLRTNRDQHNLTNKEGHLQSPN